MGIREQQKEKRRWEILSAALDLFIKKGYYATKITDIAQNVGMSTGLLFHYFESKEKLYEELIKLGISGPMSVMPPENAEPIAYLKSTAELIFKSLKTHPFTTKMFVLMGQVYYTEAVPEPVKEMLKGLDIYSPTTELIKRGQKEGTIRVGDPYAMSIAYWCAIQGISEQMAVLPDAPCPEADWIVDMIRRKD